MADEIAQDLNTASDALMKAFEMAEEMETVLCLYQDKDGHLGYVSNVDSVFIQVGLIELAKQLIAKRAYASGREDDDGA